MSERLNDLNEGIINDLVEFLGVENNESNFAAAYSALEKLDAGSAADVKALEGLMKAFADRNRDSAISRNISAPYVRKYLEVVKQYPEVQPVENPERFGLVAGRDFPAGNKKAAASAIGNLKTARGDAEVVTRAEQLKIDTFAAEAAYASGDVWAGKFLQVVRQYDLQKQAQKIDAKPNPGR